MFCAEALTEEGKDYYHISLKHPTEQNIKQAADSLSSEDEPKGNTSQDVAQATIDQVPKHFHISLLSDDDLIFLMKNVYKDELCWEYFSRQNRRHPIWKSEAEYRALFDEKLGPESLDKLEEEFASLGKYLDFMNGNFPIINKSALSRIKRELDEADQELLGNDWENTVNSYKTHIKWMECLERAATVGGFDFDIVLIRAKKFDSGFSKAELSRIPIQFKNLNTVKPFGSVITSLDSVKKRDNFFYLYAKRNSGEINITAFVNEIIQTIFK